MTTMNQDEIFSVLNDLLVEKGFLTKKAANSGIWTSHAQTAWESYAYHVLGKNLHFLVPNSKEDLIRLGIGVPEMIQQPQPVQTKTESPVAAPSSNTSKPEPKTLNRVINHDADDL